MPNKMIYIAGPIGNGGTATDEQTQENVLRAETLMKDLMLKGYSPICPHLSFYPWKNWRDNDNFDMGWEHWMRIDKEFVHACDYFFYMTPEAYGPSKGASLELAQAKNEGKRIFTDITEVPDKIEISE